MPRRVTVVEEEAQTIVRTGNVEVVVTQDHVVLKDRGRRVFKRRLSLPRLGNRRQRVNETVNG